MTSTPWRLLHDRYPWRLLHDRYPWRLLHDRYPWRLLHDRYPLEVAYGVGWGTSWKVLFTRSDVEAVWWILTDISDLFKLRGLALCTAVIVIIVIIVGVTPEIVFTM